MEVKVCPKCALENQSHKITCSGCYSSLENVAITTSEKSESIIQPNPAFVPPAPRPPRPPAPAPQPPAPAVTQQMTAPPTPVSDTPPPDPSGVPVFSDQPMPVYRASPIVYQEPKKWPIIVGGLVVLAAMVVVALLMAPKKPPMPTAPPENTVTAFLEAKKTGDLAKVKPYLSAKSVEFLSKTFGDRAARSAGINEAEVGKMFLFDAAPSQTELVRGQVTGVKNTSTEEDAKNDTAVVQATVSTQSQFLGEMSDKYQFVLVPEEGKWKIDLAATKERAPSATGDAMQKLMDFQRGK